MKWQRDTNSSFYLSATGLQQLQQVELSRGLLTPQLHDSSILTLNCFMKMKRHPELFAMPSRFQKVSYMAQNLQAKTSLLLAVTARAMTKIQKHARAPLRRKLKSDFALMNCISVSK